jgi:hypothetical protein
LQKLCLIAISTSSNRSIDSIALEVQEDRLQIITNRIVLEDSRGVPIRPTTLEPYSTTELQEFIKGPFLEWNRAGGSDRYFVGGRPFWIDLWDIVDTEQGSIITWYLPEAN